MLTESSYLTAIYVYVGAAVMILLLLATWLGRRWGAGWTSLVVLLSAALLLTPAYPRDGVETMAPASVVAGFLLLTEGVEAAEHALRPLAAFSAAAVILAVLLRLTVFRRRRGHAEPQGAGAAAPDG